MEFIVFPGFIHLNLPYLYNKKQWQAYLWKKSSFWIDSVILQI